MVGGPARLVSSRIKSHTPCSDRPSASRPLSRSRVPVFASDEARRSQDNVYAGRATPASVVAGCTRSAGGTVLVLGAEFGASVPDFGESVSAGSDSVPAGAIGESILAPSVSRRATPRSHLARSQGGGEDDQAETEPGRERGERGNVGGSELSGHLRPLGVAGRGASPACAAIVRVAHVNSES